jgi:hypothetical protein
MASILLFILAVITLAVSLWNFKTKHNQYRDYNNDVVLNTDTSKREVEINPGTDKWRWLFQSKRERRRDYYRNEYLKSDAWRRKRYVVLKRDNWRCIHCGAHATQVHHKMYAPKNIGKEPIAWLESVCKSCHDSLHH